MPQMASVFHSDRRLADLIGDGTPPVGDGQAGHRQVGHDRGDRGHGAANEGAAHRRTTGSGDPAVPDHEMGLKTAKHSAEVARVVGDCGYACGSWPERPAGGEDCQHLTATKRAVELVEIAAAAAADKLASDIIAYDVSEQLVITDAFLLCSAANDRQVRSIVDEIEEKLRRVGARPARREGEREARWVLLDYIDIVVHVQHAEERVYYSLERLWKDCPLIPVPEPVGAVGRNGSGPADRG